MLNETFSVIFKRRVPFILFSSFGEIRLDEYQTDRVSAKKSITRRGKVKAAFYFSPSLTVTAMSVLILCLPSNVNRQVTSLVFQASKNMKRIWKCLEHTTEPVFMRQLRPIRSSDNPMATAAQAQKKPKRSSLRGLMSYTEMMMRRKMTQLILILD